MVPVKHFSSAAEMQEHYKAVHARLFQAKPKPVVIAAPNPVLPALSVRKAEIEDLAPSLQPKAKARQIVAETAERHGFTADEILGPGKKASLVKARWEAMALVRREFPAWSLPQIGMFFNRDHTSVLHALRMAAKMEVVGE